MEIVKSSSDFFVAWVCCAWHIPQSRVLFPKGGCMQLAETPAEDTTTFTVVEFNPVKGSVLECRSCGNQVLWSSHEPPKSCKACSST